MPSEITMCCAKGKQSATCPFLSCNVQQEIEQRCNEVIRGAHAVRQITVDSSNREALASSTLLRGNLPPADSVRGVVRLIEIEGVDINACGGTHLRSTAELQVTFFC